MPWSNQNGGGGWKGGGPWGSGPGGGGSQQPDLEEILKRSQDRLKQAMPGGGMSPGILFLAILVAMAAIGFTLFTVRVNPDEQGIVTRFGAYHHTLNAGLNFRLPYPIEEVYLPKVTSLNRTVIGSGRGSDDRTTPRGRPDEGLMLTGDENIVDVDFTVFWRISDAPKFLFNLKDGIAFLDGEPARTVKDVGESAMREVVGKSDIEPILTQDRARIEEAVRVLMQQTLDTYGAGIRSRRSSFQSVEPPSQVIDAFRDVPGRSRADLERVQNEAQAYANRVVPEARGEAERIIQAAEGYKQQVVAEAQGEASRFTKIYEEYRKAPDVTRERMFLETMQRVLGDKDKIILDTKGLGQGVVPYLPLGELGGKPKTGEK
ncbi:MAG: FtsH protease activity modulator HflK [Hyphomicrobiaceae bacterium]